MQAQETDLAGVVESLRERVCALEARVALLEAGARPAQADRPALAAPDEPAPGQPLDLAGLAAVAGQGLLGLAGAYLLRALTEQGVLPLILGYSAGAFYAAVWLVLVWRSGRSGGSLRAAMFGAVSCSVAFPLIWEATARVHLLGPVGAALALTLMTGALLLVASDVRLQSLAWIAVTCAVGTVLALMPDSTRLTPVVLFTTGLGVATLWLGYVRDWFALRWPMAVVANLLVCWVVFGVPPGRGLETPATAVGLGLVLTAAYLGSILIRTLWRARDVVPFEVVQGCAALAVGIGGALALGRDGGTVVVGVATLLLGAACYLAAAFVARQRGASANVHFYTTLALALAMTGILLVFAPASAATVLAVCAAGSGVVAARRGPPVLALHAAAYGSAAALASGLAPEAWTRMIASPAGGHTWTPLGAVTAWVTVACAASLATPRVDSAPWPLPARLARAVVLAIVLAGLAAWTIQTARPLVLRGEAVDDGALATLRTVVLALSAVGLARLASRPAFGEALWLALAALVVGALKLLVQDFPSSRPATLFVALAAYGVALIAAPKLWRRQP
ncbi:MAG: hypothetical protein U0Q55_01095 [Vicinamibacterales bacterium]